jgi:hypothetical protein
VPPPPDFIPYVKLMFLYYVMLMLELMFCYVDSIVLIDVDDALCWSLCFFMLMFCYAYVRLSPSV